MDTTAESVGLESHAARRATARRTALCCGVLAQLVATACGTNRQTNAAAPTKRTANATPTPPAADSSQPLRPPSFTFVAPQAWRSSKPGAAPIEPPDLAQETWRVLVTQNQPLQKKTPVWQPLPARETVDVQMPEGSKFRCVVAPLQLVTDANTWGNKLKAWELKRSVLCSSDGWRSWTEAVHGVRQPVGAARDAETSTGLLLRVRDSDGSVRQSFVLLRADKEKREATTGPPRVLAGVPVDDD